jgi:DNA recombination protein RmuC
MENLDLVLVLLFGVVVGAVVAWLWTKQKLSGNISETKFNKLKSEYDNLNNELSVEIQKVSQLNTDLKEANSKIEHKEGVINENIGELAKFKANLKSTLDKNEELQVLFEKKSAEVDTLNNDILVLNTDKAKLESTKESNTITILSLTTDVEKLKESLQEKTNEFNSTNELLATFKADNKALQEKLVTQKKEIEELGKKFNTEFTNIANKILEEKTQKFTDVNKESLETILKPLGENIDKFKKQVEDVYDKESKERFSLAEQVKQMSDLNKIISEEAKNLTQALKGEAKTQGNWGEMILESILEKSGLRKDEEYFMEHQLLDEDGKPLRSDSENKKMRPDAVIKYPDNRNVIIDSKVSLNAFSRYLSATNKEDQDRELQMHVTAIKNHIVSLSTKGYDDYDKALDFVMMFIPSEPAYIAAMQGDSNLWNFAYDKRILLMNPTNLITSLKLIVDLWKREYQNQNAIEIASRGAKLYDKFVGFVKNLEGVGDYLNKAQGKYGDAYKQLTTGNDNLVSQATKLKNLGLKTKKELSKKLKS